MPYLKPDFRNEIDRFGLDELKAYFAGIYEDSNAVGALNYIICSLVLARSQKQGAKYQRYNGFIGAIECAKQELYRRFIAEYEDQVKHENGDIT